MTLVAFETSLCNVFAGAAIAFGTQTAVIHANARMTSCFMIRSRWVVERDRKVIIAKRLFWQLASKNQVSDLLSELRYSKLWKSCFHYSMLPFNGLSLKRCVYFTH